ncbi:MAG: NAD-dependent epimerase/dehydratase family protein [Synechococcus sp.]|nr:NAD-dependent epimerase/dehydratase family protein [Synechococcus sp.]
MSAYGVIGCGYVGSDVAVRMKYAGHRVVGTTRSAERFSELKHLVNEAHQLDLTDPNADFSFLESLDGLLISVAPTQRSEGYDSVFSRGMSTLTRALRCRQSSQPLHVTLISSAGVYGDQQGQSVDEETRLDTSNPANALLASAEDMILSIDRPDTTICVLRLGGIYGPGRNMVAMIQRAAGQQVPKDGNAIPAWSGILDITKGVQFAFDERLQGIYNLVDDMQLSRRELSTVICDREGLPPVLWGYSDPQGSRSLNAKVSNRKIKAAGFALSSPSMLEMAVA